MAKEVVVTHEGYKKLEQELDSLRTVKRKEVAEKIRSPAATATYPKTPSTTPPRRSRPS